MFLLILFSHLFSFSDAKDLFVISFELLALHVRYVFEAYTSAQKLWKLFITFYAHLVVEL